MQNISTIDNASEIIESICDRLAERSATLFLGAGVNANVKDNKGTSFPLGQALSNWISSDLLNETKFEMPLTESSEMARYKLGSDAVNKYLYEKFDNFLPGTAHLSLVQLPWDVIYTTNYDLLVERAALVPSVTPAGTIQQVFSVQKDLTSFDESDILYYKIHGSIDYANTPEGRLILTKEDYRYYYTHRKPLFKRLKKDLLSRTFLFVGYSLLDDNFRSILDDCLAEVDISNLPLSYSIQYSFSNVQEVYWREKYNIQLVQGDASEFLGALKETWIAQERTITPFDNRKTKEYLRFDEVTQFPKVAESFYRIHPSYCNGLSNPQKFFKGAEPSWNDINQKIMPDRDAYWPILEALFPELVNTAISPTAYLITGAAGTGKTTLLYSLAMNIARDFDLPVLVHIPSTPLDAILLRSLAQNEESKRIIICIRHAADLVKELERFLNEARQYKLPITILLEERKNQWTVASNYLKSRFPLIEFELGTLSIAEIENILKNLNIHGCLGKLTSMPLEYQIQHFQRLANKDLLVALRELTAQGTFDEIIRDEFNKIPSKKAQEAYVYVATFGQLDIPIRYEVIVSLMNLRYDELFSEIFQPAEGILLSGETTGKSRHDKGFRLSARHPVIASIIFDKAAPDDESKLVILNKLLALLDPGFREDRKLLDTIIRRKELLNTLTFPESCRAIYIRLGNLMPDNAFVLQHRSILERDLGMATEAVSYARKALEFNKSNSGIANTLGLALEFQAREINDLLHRRALLSEASRYFEDGIKKDSTDPYGYLGKYYILKQQLDRENNIELKTLIHADIISLIDEAYELTEESEVIANIMAQQQQQMGQSDEAVVVLQTALKKDPTNYRVRDRLIDIESKRNIQEALTIAMTGAQLDATAWKLQRHVARLQKIVGAPIISIKGHYEAAIRHNKGNLSLLIEYGAFLFKNELYTESKSVFTSSMQLPVGSQKKRMIHQFWKDESGSDLIFNGKIKSIDGALITAIAVPKNFEATFWRSADNLNFREGQTIKFNVGFNASGAQARSVTRS